MSSTALLLSYAAFSQHALVAGSSFALNVYAMHAASAAHCSQQAGASAAATPPPSRSLPGKHVLWWSG